MSPHHWQEAAISHIITLVKDNLCAPLLLVRPTGGAGKSVVRDMVGVILAGVTLSISPLLSLAADQTNKVGTKASQEFGNVLSFHLDEIRDRNKQQAVATSVLQKNVYQAIPHRPYSHLPYHKFLSTILYGKKIWMYLSRRSC
jgi:superfamily II DNA helicase RecQ